MRCSQQGNEQKGQKLSPLKVVQLDFSLRANETNPHVRVVLLPTSSNPSARGRCGDAAGCASHHVAINVKVCAERTDGRSIRTHARTECQLAIKKFGGYDAYVAALHIGREFGMKVIGWGVSSEAQSTIPVQVNHFETVPQTSIPAMAFTFYADQN